MATSTPQQGTTPAQQPTQQNGSAPAPVAQQQGSVKFSDWAAI
ncbi:MAG: hypothetical protein Q7J57_14760 [Gemmobacter sp.]|nr:hypothetical protein [Gemmobacter sp.]